jgi:ubiquitin-protein ligase
MKNRIINEYEQVLQAIEDEVLQYITVELSHKNNAVDYNEWNIVIYGKDGTIWDGGEFKCTMQFPEGYPNQPPLFLMPKHFLHMNVYISGRVCVDVLNLP